MSEQDVEHHEVSELDEAGERDERMDKQVPVSEAIRYRRRAQAAERNIEALSQRLGQAEETRVALAQRVESLEEERGLTRRLAEAGAVDLEAALLLARERLSASEGGEVEAVVAQLRRDKAYLFAPAAHRPPTTAAMISTAGAKEPVDVHHRAIEQAAQRAKETQDPRDLCEYLRVRRQFV